MKKRQLSCMVGSLCLILIIIALPFKSAYAKEDSNPEKVYTLRLNDNMIWKTTVIGSFSEKDGLFIRKIAERSGGRLKIDVKMDQFPTNDGLYACIDGRIDITTAAPSYYDGTFPIWFFGGLPFLTKDMHEYKAIINAPKTRNILNRLYRKAGVVYLSGGHAGEQDGLCSTKPVANAADFKGLKLRTSGDLQLDSLSALGASSISIVYAELATALSLGTVDGFISGLTATVLRRVYKMTPYVNRWPICNAWTLDLWMNAKKFDSLPKDLQKILLEAGKEMEDIIYFAASAEDSACELVMASKDLKGVTVVTPAAAEIEKAKSITAPVWDRWAKKHGPDARELLDAISEVLADYRAKKSK